MSKPFTLTDAMFDDNGNCIEPFVFDLASPNGIESLRVNIGSTSSRFMASMAAIRLPKRSTSARSTHRRRQASYSKDSATL